MPPTPDALFRALWQAESAEYRTAIPAVARIQYNATIIEGK
jgi:hypothetical protein